MVSLYTCCSFYLLFNKNNLARASNEANSIFTLFLVIFQIQTSTLAFNLTFAFALGLLGIYTNTNLLRIIRLALKLFVKD